MSLRIDTTILSHHMALNNDINMKAIIWQLAVLVRIIHFLPLDLLSVLSADTGLWAPICCLTSIDGPRVILHT